MYLEQRCIKASNTTKAVRPLVKSSDAQLKNTIKECTRREAGVSVLFDRNLGKISVFTK